MDEMNNVRTRFREKNMALWDAALKALFPVAMPTRCVWTQAEEIVAVLNQIGGRVKDDENSYIPISHTFMPDEGGIHSDGAELSAEAGCIVLLSDGGSVNIVKPQSVTFESFGNATEWAYFRLEIDPLEPTGLYDGGYQANIREVITQVSPGNYAPQHVWEQGFLRYDEDDYEVPLPESARRASRYFSGSFVIFAESSPYNADPSTYDARHAKMTAKEFRAYIQRSIDGMPQRNTEAEA